MGTRAITPDERAELRRYGHEVGPNAVIDDQGNVSEASTAQPPPESEEAQTKAPQEYSAGTLGKDLVGRQVGRAALPLAAGAGAGALTTSAIAGTALGGPIGTVVAPLVVGGITAMLASKGQDKVIKSITKNNPNSWLAQNEMMAQEDVKRHPWASTGVTLPMAGLLPGGSFIPKPQNLLRNPKLGATLAGAQMGIAAAPSILQGELPDPVQLGIAGLGSTFLNAPKTTGIPKTAVPKGAPEPPPDVHPDLKFTGPPKPKTPLDVTDMQTWLTAPPEKLMSGIEIAREDAGLVDFAKTLATFAQKGGVRTPELINDMIKRGPSQGYGRVAFEHFTSTDLPKITADELKTQAEQGIAKAKADQLAYEKDLAERAKLLIDNEAKRTEEESKAKYTEKLQDTINQAKVDALPKGELQISTPERTTSVTEEGITQPESTGEAKASAEAILSHTKSSPKDAIAAFRKAEAELNKLVAHAEEYPEGHPIREQLNNFIAERRSRIEADLEAALSNATITTPERKLAVSLEEPNKPREMGEIKAPSEDADVLPKPPLGGTYKGPSPEGLRPAPDATVEFGGNTYERRGSEWTLKGGGKLDPNNPETGPVVDKNDLIENLNKAELRDTLLARQESQDMPGKREPEATAQARAQAHANEVGEAVLKKAEIEGANPEAKPVLGIKVPKAQAERIKTATIEGFKAGLEDEGMQGFELRDMVATHPSFEKWRELNPGLTDQEAAIRFFDKLHPADQKWFAEANVAGKTAWSPMKLPASTEMLLQAREAAKAAKEAAKKAPKISTTLKKTTPAAPTSAVEVAPEGKVIPVRPDLAPKEPLVAPAKPTSAVENKVLPKVKKTKKSDKSKKAETPAKVEAGEQPKGEMIPLKPGETKPPPSDTALGIKPRISLKTPVDLMSKYTRATVDRIKDIGTIGKRMAKKVEDMYIGKRAQEEPWQKANTDIEGTLKGDEITQVGQYLNERNATGSSSVKLTPKQEEAVKAIDELIVSKMGADKARPDAPPIESFDATGKPIYRRFEMIKNWFPSKISKEVRDALNNPHKNEALYNKLREDYIKWHIDKYGSNRNVAEEAFANRKGSIEGHTPSDILPKHLHVMEGEGAPLSWLETNPFKALRAVINQHATGMNFYRNIELDPVLNKALNLDTRGTTRPEVTLDETGKPVELGYIASNPDVQATLRDYFGSLGSSQAQKIEKFQGIFHAMQIGPWSQIRNFTQNLGAIHELLLPEERSFMGEGFRKMLNKEAFQTALESGSVRHKRNVVSAVAQDAESAMNKITDLITRYSGSEAISKANDVYLDVVGRAVARNRLKTGDAKFLDEFGPADWRKKSLDEVINHVAAKFQRTFSGAYDATDLPPALLRGSNAPLATIFKLARWSTGRFNNWEKNVYQPAKNGNVKPLIRSLAGGMLAAGAINTLTELVTGRKPKELTWSEYLGLGGKDHAYTLFSKAATASYGGLLSDLLFGGVQILHGEMPRSYNNLVLSSMKNTVVNLAQFGQALTSGQETLASGFPKLVAALGKNNIQVLRLLAGPPPEEGKREEKIARRLGVLPSRGNFDYGVPNPFGEAAAYRNQDSKSLSRILSTKMANKQRISAPDKSIRDRSYYELIGQMQGEEAKEEALNRDKQKTKEDIKTFTSALRNRH